MKIPIDVAKSIQLINTGKPLKIDALILNGQPFFMTAGIGYDAKVIEQFNKLPFRGVNAYLTGILTTVFSYKLPTFTIEIDNEKTIETEAFTVLATSTGQLGYNVEFTKNSVLNDGKFEVCIVRDFNKTRLPNLIYESFFGDIASQDIIETHRVNKILKVRANNIESIQMDGDYKGKTNYIEVTGQKQAINFLVDKDYEI
ncbi:MAG: hypothetical protein R2807_07095 [Chitinophagales bacterium]